jgi:hypothetical protein
MTVPQQIVQGELGTSNDHEAVEVDNQKQRRQGEDPQTKSSYTVEIPTSFS